LLYQQKVVKLVKETHPDTPLILYISGSAGILERMGRSGVDMPDTRQRLGSAMKVQGNTDPCVLFGSQDTARKAGQGGHILNLGHGVLVSTPEDNVRFFFETAKQVDKLL
jgi:uroporphyrinogen decarboxylase